MYFWDQAGAGTVHGAGIAGAGAIPGHLTPGTAGAGTVRGDIIQDGQIRGAGTAGTIWAGDAETIFTTATYTTAMDGTMAWVATGTTVMITLIRCTEAAREDLCPLL